MFSLLKVNSNMAHLYPHCTTAQTPALIMPRARLTHLFLSRQKDKSRSNPPYVAPNFINPNREFAISD